MNSYMIDKKKLKEALIQMAHHTIDESGMDYHNFLDAQAQYRESQNLAETLHEQVHEHQEQLKVITEIDFADTDTIGPGVAQAAQDVHRPRRAHPRLRNPRPPTTMSDAIGSIRLADGQRWF